MPLWDKENYGFLGSLNPKQNVSYTHCGEGPKFDGLSQQQGQQLRSGQKGTVQPVPLGQSSWNNVQAGAAPGAPPLRFDKLQEAQLSSATNAPLEHRAVPLNSACENGCTPAPRPGMSVLQGFPVAPRKLVLDSPISEEPSQLGFPVVQSCPARNVTRAAGTRTFVRVRVRRTLKLQSRTTGTVGASTQPSKALGWGPQTGHTPKLTASQSMDLETATARKPFIRKRPDTPWKDNARRVRLRDAGWDAADEIARLSLH